VSTWVVVTASVLYLGLLFAIAAYGDRRAATGRSLVANGWVYTLSLSVYATSWTYYGSVGRAASTGMGFLPVYLGPTLMVALWWVVLRKIIHISRRDRITSLADFVASRYGRSVALGRLVTVVTVVGVVPYIALQLKAVSATFDLLRGAQAGVLGDSALYVALFLAAFTLLFGTRHLDASERHEGMVAAIAVESVVKLLAFLAVGAWVTFGLFDGVHDLVAQAAARPDTAALFRIEDTTGYASWFWVLIISGLAVLLLPRQWQVAVIENVDTSHIRRAMVAFPLYLVAINLFVMPIALAGLLTLGQGADADAFVLSLPLEAGHEALALAVFVGGLSAATGMVIVETIAMATMVSNSLVMPLLLRRERLAGSADLSRLVLAVRRTTIVAVLLLGYAYVRLAGEGLGLVAIGLVSFAAVAQFAPAVLGGLFWRGATLRGAVGGILGGFVVWVYMLLLPSFARAGWLPESFITDGPWGISALAPEAFLGLDGLDSISHAMVWSSMVNIGMFVGLSITGRAGAAERMQAAVFVDAYRLPRDAADARTWRTRATVDQLRTLLERFLGPDGTSAALEAYAQTTPVDLAPGAAADAALVHHVEALLAGAIGTVSARVMVASVVEEEPLGLTEVLDILDEASQVRAYSKALEQQSRELEAATAELREANERLTELDRMKDDFVSTVSHELRTPLTSIRAFSEILLDTDDIDDEQRREFLEIIVAEAGRLTRLINQVLDLSKLESGKADWHLERLDMRDVVQRSVHTCEQLFTDRGARVEVDLGPRGPVEGRMDDERLGDVVPVVDAEEDRVVQVIVNLLSNAAKFCDPDAGLVTVRLRVRPEEADNGTVRVDVVDNGPGVPADQRTAIFDKFHQVDDAQRGRPAGTGLGLPISKEIVTRLGGRLWVEDVPGPGAMFSFTLPLADGGAPDEARAPVRASMEGRL
jgi:Na+/proline symporter/signal transduction histidine kinase